MHFIVNIKRKKKSLPIILTLNSSNISASKKVNKIMSKRNLNQKDVNNVMDVMSTLKIKEKCEMISRKYQNNIEQIVKRYKYNKQDKQAEFVNAFEGFIKDLTYNKK